MAGGSEAGTVWVDMTKSQAKYEPGDFELGEELLNVRPSRTPGIVVSVQFTHEEAKALRKAASERQMPTTELIRRAVEEHLKAKPVS